MGHRFSLCTRKKFEKFVEIRPLLVVSPFIPPSEHTLITRTPSPPYSEHCNHMHTLTTRNITVTTHIPLPDNCSYYNSITRLNCVFVCLTLCACVLVCLCACVLVCLCACVLACLRACVLMSLCVCVLVCSNHMCSCAYLLCVSGMRRARWDSREHRFVVSWRYLPPGPFDKQTPTSITLLLTLCNTPSHICIPLYIYYPIL